MSFDVKHRLVSSAYMEKEKLFNTHERLLIYNKNKSGIKHDTYGTTIEKLKML